MFKVETIDLKTSGSINPLVLDYLDRKESLKSFYNHYPDRKGFSEILNENLFTNFDRNSLSEILLKQSLLVNNTSSFSLKKIESLKQKNVFTVTTGHQLCIFTGPLYFIYKIFSTINLAEELKKEFPDFDFVPVYWMASEDHDFEEVNHFNLFGKVFNWESKQTGAVGDFKTDELNDLSTILKESLGSTENAEFLSKLFEKTYLKNTNLKDATRFLANELFGAYGLVIVDGHDVQFKHQIKEILDQEIFKNISIEKVKESTDALNKMGYATQVNPREINCFYLENNLRARIEKVGDKFQVLGTDISFTETELKTLINKHPEKFSPNVVLRPIYQQIILPNIAYVGGPGELAYWLQYKKMFDALNVLFPILIPRNFITIIDSGIKNKIDKLNFRPADFFKDIQELITEFQLKTNNVFELEKEKEEVTKLYTHIIEKVTLVDKTLNAASLAELQKTINGLDLLITKANKALKQRSETELNQITAVKQKLFPNSIPQERFDNFSGLYLKYGISFFKALKEKIQPFELNHKLFIENIG
ncbi:MAG: bacillithiol biosynthesis cysteine-adding enzyme BshC [Bacteroidota bacterium]|nr:bacillithiol biosynthesis cysteine-adding enzyme BshC [Bacteroidota bacterium]MDP3146574.1 bacillithiol biosynthesis cysteine-adding enzyme BshC [Bacteroidota bacterium]MDP3556792.1 bacillithiol biosynthesis cysteine-adding enzyme BshC [Bacteroidota bacterium]